MGGAVDAVGDLAGKVLDPVSTAAGAIPVVGPIAGPVIGGITGGPLGFATSVGGNILQGNYGGGGGGSGGNGGGGGGGDGGAGSYPGPVPYTPPFNPFLPTLYPQNTAPVPPIQNTAPVPPTQNTAPYRPNPPPVPTTQNTARNSFDANQYYLNIGREQGRFPPPPPLAINRAQSGSGQVPFGNRPPQLGSGKSPLRQDLLGTNRAPVGGIATLNRPGMSPLSRFGRN